VVVVAPAALELILGLLYHLDLLLQLQLVPVAAAVLTELYQALLDLILCLVQLPLLAVAVAVQTPALQDSRAGPEEEVLQVLALTPMVAQEIPHQLPLHKEMTED
jgi:hypothetical protein